MSEGLQMVDNVEVFVTEAAQAGDATALSKLVAAHGSGADGQ